jgi:dTDP-4-dehydrorhamnose reductase
VRVLVTGAAGKLGSRLMLQLSERGHTALGTDTQSLDITHWESTRTAIVSALPDVIIHCAAWTDVDGCAREPERAHAINGFGTGNVAAAAYEVGALMCHVSTNEVFDGTLPRPYNESDQPNPINPYGASKYAGELSVIRSAPRYQIVRTSWLFAHGGRNFIQTILNAAREGKTLRVVTDEMANPTYNDDLANAILKLIETRRPGVYHLANQGTVSRWEFARYALDRAGMTDIPVERITRADWPRPSIPPEHAGLDNRNAALLGITLRPWQHAVEAFLDREGLLKG